MGMSHAAAQVTNLSSDEILDLTAEMPFQLVLCKNAAAALETST